MFLSLLALAFVSRGGIIKIVPVDAGSVSPHASLSNYTSAETPAFIVSTNHFVSEKTARKEQGKLSVDNGNISAEVQAGDNKSTDIIPVITGGQAHADDFLVSVPDTRSFKPGKYKLNITLHSNGKADQKISQDFTWGVLAVNLDQSTYQPGETAQIGMGVLDDNGVTLCDAKVKLEITDPGGNTTTLSTDNKGVTVSSLCRDKSVTNLPDYAASYKVGAVGKYGLTLTADTKNGTRSVQQTFNAVNTANFVTKRYDTATRIYPAANYLVHTSISSYQTFIGSVRERVPASFEISDAKLKIGGQTISATKIYNSYQDKIIEWSNVGLLPGDKAEITYNYRAPFVSPEFYLLGKIELVNQSGNTVFTEPRAWQIASDSTNDVYMLWDTANGAVPSGWCDMSIPLSCNGNAATFAGFFPRASDTYGGTYSEPASHTHSLSAPTISLNGTTGVSLTLQNVSSNTHTHTWPTVTLNNNTTTIDPLYQDLKVIKATNPASLPRNIIGMFDVPTSSFGSGDLADWTSYHQLNGDSSAPNNIQRFLRGDANNNTGGAASHNHAENASGTVGNSSGNAATTSSISTAANSSHTHTFPTGPTADEPNNPLSVTIVFGILNVDGEMPPNGLIAMFDSATLPVGWSTISSSSSVYYQRLLLGGTSAGTQAGVSTHNHGGSISITTGGASATGGATALTGSNAASATHTHTLAYTITTSASSMPSYRDVILGKLHSIHISGTAYSDEGTTNLGSGISIKAAISGSGYRIVTTTTGGAYTMNVPDPGAGTPLTVWINGVANTTGAVTTRTSGADITGLDIYQNRLIVRHDDSGPISNANIAACTKNNGTACAGTTPPNTDLHFDTDASNNLTVDNDWRLYVWGGKNFTPGANVTLSAGAVSSAIGGSVKWGSTTSTLAMSTNALSVGGNWDNSAGGVFTNSAGQTTTFNATSTGFTVNAGSNASNDFQNLIFNGTGGGWAPVTNTVTVLGDLTVTAGTLGTGSETADVTVNGNVGCGTTCGTVNLTGSGRTFTQSVAAAKNFGTNVAVSTIWSFNNLTFSASPASTITTSSTGTGNIVTKSVLTISTGVTLDAGNRTFELNGNGTPFVKTGTLTQNTSTFLYQPASTTGVTVTNATYHNVTFNKTGNTFSLTTGGITTDTANSGGNLTITAGTLDSVSASNYPISVGGSWSNSDTFLAQAGTVTFNSVSSGKTIAGNLTGSNKFNTVVFNGVGGAWSFSNNADVGGDFTITNGSVTAPAALSITGSYSNAGTFTHNSGTVTFNATGAKTINSGGTGAGKDFNNITFNGSGSWTIQTNNLNTLGSIVLTQGTVNNSSVTVSTNGHLDCGGGASCGTVNFTGTSVFIQRISGAQDFGPDASTAYNTDWVFQDLRFEDSAATDQTVTVNANSGTGRIVTNGTLTIGNATDTNVTTFDDSGINKRPLLLNGSLNITSKGKFIAPGAGVSFTIGANWTNSGVFTNNGGTVTFSSASGGNTIAGNLTGTNAFNNLTFTGGGGWSFSNDVTISGNLTVTSGTISGGNTIVNGGNATGDGTVNLSSGTFQLTGTGNFSGNTPWTFNNLTFGDGSTVATTTTTGTGSVTVNGVLTIGTNHTLNTGSKNWIMTAAGTPITRNGTLSSGTSTFKYTSGTGVTALSSAAMTGSNAFYNLIINGTGTFNAGVAIAANDNLTVTTGTLAMGSNNLTVGSSSVTDSGTISVATSQSLTQTGGTTTLLSSSGSTVPTIGGGGSISFNNLSFLPTAASGPTFTIGTASSQTYSVLGDMTIGNATNAVTVKPFDSTITLNIGGSWTTAASATFTHNNGTITFNGASAANKTIDPGISRFYKVTFASGATNHWKPINNTMFIDSDLTVTAGYFDDAAAGALSNVTVQGNVTGNGTISFTSTNTFTHKATGGNMNFGSSGGTAWVFNNLTEDNDGLFRTITAVSGIGATTINGTWTINASDTFSAGAGLYILTGTGTPFVNNGTFTYGTSTVRYTGNGSNITAMSGIGGSNGYYNLEAKPAGSTQEILGTGTSQTVAVNNNLTVGNGTNNGATAGTFNTSLDVNGDVIIAANATLTGPASSSFTVAGNWTNSGTYTANNGTVALDNAAASNKTINNNTSSFYNLIFTGGASSTWSALTNTLVVANDLTMTSGTLNSAGGSANITVNGNVACGATCGIITLTAAGQTFTQRVGAVKNFGTSIAASSAWSFVNLTFSNSAGTGQTVTTSTADTSGITVSGILKIGASGDTAGTTLNAGNRTWTLSASGQTTSAPFQVLASPAGTLTPATSTFTFTGTATTDVQGSITYNNLTINAASGTPTFGPTGTITTNANTTVTNGTFNLGANTLNTAGDLILNGANAVLNGTGNQTINGNVNCGGGTCGTITLTGGTFTQSVSAAKNFGTTQGSNNWTFQALTFTNTSGTNAITINPTGTGQIIASGNVSTSNSGTALTLDDNTNNRYFNFNGDLTIGAGTTLLAPPSNTFSVAGSWTNSGTFTHDSGTVTFDGTASGKTINVGSSTFNNLIFNGSGGVWSPRTNKLVVASGGTLTMTAGTLGTGADTADIEVDGNIANTGTGVISMTTSTTPGNTFTHKATGGNKNFGGNAVWTFYNLTFDNDAIARTITSNGTSKVTVSNVLTITASTTLNTGARQYDLTASGNPMVVNGTFTADASANKSNITFNGQTATNVNALTYYDLGVGTTADTSVSVTYSLTGFTKVLDVLTLGNGTSTNIDHLAGGSNTLELAGTGTPLNATTKGDYVVGTSTVNYTGQDGVNPIFVAALSFYNLGAGTTADGTATTYKLSGNTTVTNVLTVGNNSSTASDTFDGASYTLTLSGTGTPFVVSTHGNWGPSTSTVNYTGQDGVNPIFVGGTNYYNLGAGTTADGTATTYKLAGSALVTHQLTVGNNSSTANDTFDGASYTLTLSGSGQGASAPFIVTTHGAWGASTSTVNYTASTGTTDVGGTNYYNLGIGTTTDSTAANTFVLTGNATVANVLTQGNATSTNGDTLDGGSGSITFTLSGTNVTPWVIANAGDTFIPNAGTVNYNGYGTINLAPVTFYNLGLRTSSNTDPATTFTLPGNTTINNVITVGNALSTNTTTLDGASYTLTLAGSGTPLVLAGSGMGLFTASTSTVNYTGTTATNVTAVTYYNLGVGTTADNNAVTYTMLGNTTVGHQLTVGNASSTATDILSLGSTTLTLSGSGTGASAPFQMTAHGTTSVGTSTVNYTGGATTDVAATNYYNLGVGTTANATSVTYNLTGFTKVTSILTIGAASESPSNPDHLSGGSNTLELAGSGTPLHADNGDYVVGTSTVNYTASSATNVAALSYYILGVGTTADATATTYSLMGNTTVTNYLSIGAAGDTNPDHLSGLTYTLTMSGTGRTPNQPLRAPNGDYVVGTSTVNYTGDGATGVDVAALSYYNLGIGTTALTNATTYYMLGTTTVTNKLILGTTSGQNATFNANGANTLQFTGGGTGASAPFQANTTGVFSPSTGTVEYDGNTDTDVPARTFYNLKFNPASGSPNFYLLAGTLTVNNSLSITTSGTATEIVHADTYNPTINLNADFSLSIGTFVASASGTFTVAGNWTNGATFTHNSGTVTFNNSNATNKTISTGGTGAGHDFFNIVFNGNTGASWSPTGSAALTIDGDMTVTSGIVNNAGGNGVAIVVNGNVTSAANGQINLNSSNFSQRLLTTSKTFGPTAGSLDWTFKNLDFSNGSADSSIVKATIQTNNGGTGKIIVTNQMRVGGAVDGTADSGGATTTLNAGSRTWYINGSGTGASAPFIISSTPIGTLNPETSTFSYNGSSNTDIQYTTYYNLTVNASGGNQTTPVMATNGNATVTNSLTVTAGKLNLAANDMTVGATANTNSGNISVGASGAIAQTANGTTTVITSSGGTAAIGGAGSTTFYNLNFNEPSVASAPTYTLGTGASQTINISGKLTIGNGSQAVTVSATANNPTVNVGSSGVLTGGDVIISSGSTLAASSSAAFKVAGNWTNNGTFTAGTSTVTFDSTDIANRTLAGNISGSSAFYNLTFDSGGTNGFWTYSAALQAKGILAINSGTLAGTNDITVNKDVTGGASGFLILTGGTFTQQVSASQAFGTTTGSSTWRFNNLIFSNISGSASAVTITTGAGTGNIQVDSILKIGCSTCNGGGADTAGTTLNAGGRSWNIMGSGASGSRPFQILASPASALTASTSTFNYYGASATDVEPASYNNLNLIPAASPTYTLLAGTYSVAGTLNIGNGTNGLTVTAATNNPTISITGTTTIASAATLTDGTGSQTFAGDLVVNGTLNGAGSLTVNGNFNGAGIVTMTAGTLTQNITAAADKNFGSTASSNDWTFNNLTLSSGNGTRILGINGGGTGKIVVNGNLVTSVSAGALTVDDSSVARNRRFDINGDVTIGASTTLSAPPAAAFTVFGSWTNNGTFTHNNGSIIFDGTASGKTINNGSSSFYNLTFNSSNGSGVWSPLTNTLTVANDLLVTKGTFDTSSGTANVSVSGNVQCGPTCGTINMTSTNTFTQSVSANKNFGTNAASDPNWTFYNLTFANASGTNTITTNSTGTGQIIVTNNLATSNSGTALTVDDNANNRILDVNGGVTIGSGTTLMAPSSASFTVFGSWANSGTFTNDNGTVNFDGNASGKTLSGTLTGSSKFYNLTFSGASPGAWSFGSTAGEVANNFTVSSTAAVTYPSTTLTVTGNYSVVTTATITHNSGTVLFNSGNLGKTIDTGGNDSAHTLYAVQFNNGAGGWTVQTHSMKTANNFTLTNIGAFTLASGLTLEVDGTYDVSSCGTTCADKTTWTGSTLYLNSGTNYTVGSTDATAKVMDPEVYGTLQVGANTDVRMWNSSANTITVDATGSLYSMNHAAVKGQLYVYGDYHVTGTDNWKYSTDFDGTSLSGTNQRQVNVYIETGSGRGVTIDSTKTLNIVGGGGGANQFTNVDRIGGSGTYQLKNSSGSAATPQDAKINNAQFTAGTWNTQNVVVAGSTTPYVPNVAANGTTLTLDWFFNVHAVNRDAPGTNIQTGATDVTISENSGSPQSTVFEYNGSSWSGATSQTGGTDTSGNMPQPGSTGAIKLREYSQSSNGTTTTSTYYKYNVAIAAQKPASGTRYANFDFQRDYGSYITSTLNTGAGLASVMSGSWYRDVDNTKNADGTLDAAPSTGSLLAGSSAAIMLMWDGVSIPSGWTCVSCTAGDAFYQRFPRGNSTYGTQGGNLTQSHTLQSPVQSTGTSSGSSTLGTAIDIQTHQHTGIPSTASTSADSIVPLYHNLKIIYGPSSGPNAWPNGAIAPFETATPPTGWGTYSTTTFPTSNYLRGDTTLASGNNGGSATHVHTAPASTITLGAAASPNGTTTLGSTPGATAGHTHTITAGSTSLTSTANTPQYANVVFMQCTGTSAQCAANQNNILGLFDYASGFPVGWSMVSSGAPYNKSMLANAASPTGTGNAAGGFLQHTHGAGSVVLNSSSSTASTNYLSAVGTALATSTHSHTVTYSIRNDTNDAENSEPPYTDVVIAKYGTPTSLTITGNVYSDEATTVSGACDSSTTTVSVRIGGVTYGPASCNSSTGAFSIASVPQPAAGTPMVYWLDGTMCSISGNCAATVVRYSGSGAPSSLVLRNSRVIVRSDDSTAVTNNDLATWDSSGSSNVKYTVSSGNLSLASGMKLIINASNTFTPGGSVTTQPATNAASNPDGDVLISSGATLNMQSYALNVGGDYTNSGTFSKLSGQTTTFTANFNSAYTIAPGTGNFDTVVFNGASTASWSFNATVTIDNTLTVTQGTLNGTNNITVNGGNVTGNGTIALTGGTFTLNGSGNFGGATAWSFSSLTLGSGSTDTTNGYISGGGNITASVLTISASQTLNAGSHNWIVTSNTNPFVISGTFTPQTSTITFQPTGTTGVNVNATTYYNVAFNKTSNTFTLAGNIIVSNNIAITAGNLDVTATPYSITVGGSWNNSDTFTARTGTVTFNSTTTGKTIAGNGATGAFYNAVFNGSGGEWSPATTTMQVNNDLTMTAGTLDSTNGTADVLVKGNAVGSAGIINLSAGTFTLAATGAGKNFGPTTAGNNWVFNNLTFTNDGTARAVTTQSGTGTMTINGILKIGTSGDTAATTLDAGNRSWYIAGNGGNPFQILASPAGVLTANTSTFNYTGTNVSGTTVQSATYYILNMNNSSSTGSASFNGGGAITVNNNLAVLAGTLAMGANNLTVGSSSLANSGSINVVGTLSQTASGTTTINTNGTGGAATIGGIGSITFYNLTFNQPATSGVATYTLGSASGQTVTISGGLNVGNTGSGTTTVTADTNNPTIAVSGSVTVNSAGTLVASSSASFTVGSNWTNNGTFTHNTGTVTFNGSGTGNVINTGGTGTGKDFNNLVFNGSGHWTPKTSAMQVVSNLTMTSGYFDDSAGSPTNVTVLGDAIGTGGIISFATSQTFTQKATGGNKSFGPTGTVDWTFYNLTFDNDGSARIVTTQNNANSSQKIEVKTVLTTTASTTLNAGNRLWLLSGTGTPIASSGTVNGAASTIRYTGSSTTTSTNIATANVTYNNLQVYPGNTASHIIGTGAGQTLSVLGNLDLGGNSNATATTIDASTNNPALNINGNLTICAATCNTVNTVTYLKGTGTTTLMPSGTTTWSDNDTTKQDMGTVSIAVGTNTPTVNLGTSVKASYVNLAAGHTLNLNGSNTLYLTGSSTTFFIANGIFTPSSGTVEYQPTVSGSVTVANATYHHVIFDGVSGGNTFTLSSGGFATDTANGCGNVTINNNATLDVGVSDEPISVGGNWTINTGAAFNARTGTVTMTNTCGAKTIGGTLAMTGSNQFNNLTFNGSGGSWSFANNTDVGGNFTITTGTVTAPSGTLTIKGNWSNSGTFTHNNGTVAITPNSNSVVTGATTFYNFSATTPTGGGDKTITFQHNTTGAPVFTFANTVTLAGAVGRILNVRSDLAGTVWKAHFNLAQSGTYADIKDSGCDTGTANISMDLHSINSLNNEACWVFSGGSTPPNDPTALIQKRSTLGTVMNTGDWTNELKADFLATVSDPNSLTVSLCVEVRPVATAFGSEGEDACSVGAVASGAQDSVTISGLTDQTQYHWRARTKNSSGAYSNWVSYGTNAENPPTNPAGTDFGIDTTAPSVASAVTEDTLNTNPNPSPCNALADQTDNGNGSLTTLSACWSGFDTTISGLSKYRYSVGTTAGATDILAWTDNGTATYATIGGLSLHTGQMYYINVEVIDNAGNTSSVVSSNGQVVTPSLSFEIDIGGSIDPGSTSPPYSIDFGTLTANTVAPSTSRIWVSLSTNSNNGAAIYASGVHGGLYSTAANYTIGSATADLAVAASGFGLQSASTTQTSGGPLSALSPYNGVGNNVGILDSNLRSLYASTGPLTGGRASMLLQAKVNNIMPASNDYRETLTMIAAAVY